MGDQTKNTISTSETAYKRLIKHKLSNAYQAERFCGVCLESDGTLWHLETVFDITVNEKEDKKLLKDIVYYVFGNEWKDVVSGIYICSCCVEKSIQSYIFIHNAKKLAHLLNHYMDDLNSKINDLNDELLTNPLYENSNIVIVLDNLEGKSEYIDVTSKTLITAKESTGSLNGKEESVMVLNSPKIVPKISLESISPLKRIAIPDKTSENGSKNLLISRKKRSLKKISYKCLTCNKILSARSGHEKCCKVSKTTIGNKSFQCKICMETFKTQRMVRQHYRVHDMEKCRICYFLMPKGSLVDHLKLNHESIIHVCEICDHITYSTGAAATHLKKKHSNPQCIMCLRYSKESDLKNHTCKFSCLDCPEMPCIHFKYLISHRDQVLSGATKIKCLDCDYIYNKRKALLGHVNREHLDHHPFTCDHCLQQFYSKTSLKNHILTFHRESFSCQFCDADFKSKNQVNEHVKVCKWIKRELKCSQCVCTFDTLQELEDHTYTKHSSEIYPCSLCTKQFNSSIKLRDHEIKIHSGIQIKRKRTNLECTICDLKFDNRKEFTIHIDRHGPGTRFPCKVCNVDFDDIKKLHVHARFHGDDVVKCEDCNRLITEAYISQHKIYCEANRKDENNACEICGKVFQAETILKLHRQIHVEPVACPVCGKLVKPVYLKRHVKIKHGPKRAKRPLKKTAKLVKCEYCGHMVTRHGELESHINRFHLKIKPYECNICKKQFCGKERLKDHIQTHSQDNSCFCTTCGKRFANKVCLKMHTRLHTGLTPYVCDVCGEKFRSSSIMKTHRLKKHSEKTVPCPLCDTMFYLAREMRHHFKKVHWKKKNKKFDPREVEEISKEYYYLFEDRRLPKVHENDVVFSK